MLSVLGGIQRGRPPGKKEALPNIVLRNMRNLYNILYISSLLMAWSGTGTGATIMASGCSAVQVQSAINSAVSGDTVQVKAGSATWRSPVVIQNKSITLQGAGIGNTDITRNTTSNSDAALTVDITPGHVVTISGFTFSTINLAQWGIVNFVGEYGGGAPSGAQFRLTNCLINIAPSNPTIGTRGIHAIGIYGLIDHCTFSNTSANGQGLSVDAPNQWGVVTVRPTYMTPQPLGTQDFVVVEDCTFNFSGGAADGACDAYCGTKIVFRHNTVNGTNVGWHGADSEATSCRAFEVYDNAFNNTGSSIYTAVRARGGTGVVWGNTVTGNYDRFFILSAYRADPSYGGVPLGSANDGNFSQVGYAKYYPLLDQVGRGSFPESTQWPKESSYTQVQYEALDPVYQWGNNFLGNTAPTCTVDLPFQSTQYIIEGADYNDNTQKPGYVPLGYPHPLATTPSPPQNLRLIPPKQIPSNSARKRQSPRN